MHRIEANKAHDCSALGPQGCVSLPGCACARPTQWIALYVSTQGVIAGANMVLVDFHPAPSKALVDGPQALTLEELAVYLEDIAIAREAYEKPRALVAKNRKV
jgi:3-deoxy-D-manno-octulosonic acid (KDO) 8-phosphate synthase